MAMELGRSFTVVGSLNERMVSSSHINYSQLCAKTDWPELKLWLIWPRTVGRTNLPYHPNGIPCMNPFITQQRIQDKLHRNSHCNCKSHFINCHYIFAPHLQALNHYILVNWWIVIISAKSLWSLEYSIRSIKCPIHYHPRFNSLAIMSQLQCKTLQQTKHLVSTLVQLMQNNYYYCFVNEYGVTPTDAKSKLIIYDRENRTHIHRLHGNTTTSVCK